MQKQQAAEIARQKQQQALEKAEAEQELAIKKSFATDMSKGRRSLIRGLGKTSMGQ